MGEGTEVTSGTNSDSNGCAIMNRNAVIGGILIVAVLVVGLGVAVYTGVGPAPGGNGSGEPITEFPTATPSDEDTGAGETNESGAETTPVSETPPFTFTIERTEKCGQTCRDVTVTLHNNQEHAATGVAVFTRIFPGKNNTDTEDLLWEGKEDVGTLEAGESYTTTNRIELSFQEARTIDRNDGWITILTTVDSDETTVTFQDNEQVA
ncbi:hypothetical protein ACERIT_02330 [Halopenitus sp. H-Gu1]|uniref:hypothetical protein n=1 Tax=Halopenitus sp. H-Gu1 TaxID=3242697 RepID=UPI00359E63AA